MREASWNEVTSGATSGHGAQALSPSWIRILLVSGYLFVSFVIIEHEFSQAGASIELQDEEEILDRNTAGAEQGNKLRALTLLAFAGLGAVTILSGKLAPWNPHRLAFGLLIALVVWAGLSVGWAAIPGLALRRLIAWLCFVIGCFGLGRILTPREVVRVALVSLVAMIFMSFSADLLAGAGPWQSGYRFSGTLHPNVQATYCTALCLAAFCLAYDFRPATLCHVVWISGVALIYFTGSRTALLASLLAIYAAWLLRQRVTVRAMTLGAGVMVMGVLLTTFYVMKPGDQRQLTGAALLGRTEKAGSLSGRVPLWMELRHYAETRPIQGHGYDSFWTPKVMEEMLDSQKWTMTSAHNIYLETVLQLGFVGLGLGLALTLVTLALAKSRFDATGDAAFQFAFGLIIYAMLNGLLEAHFLRPKYPTALALMGFASLVLYRPKKAEAADAWEYEEADQPRAAMAGGVA
ncbi:MAG: O-antigen ligase family protein [Planctomycetota bacterium]